MSGRGRMSRGSGVGDDWMWIGGGGWRGRKGSGRYPGVRGVWTLGEREMTYGAKMRFLNVLVPKLRH